MSKINIIVCNRKRPKFETGGASAGVKNAEDVLSNNNIYLYLAEMNIVDFIRFLIKIGLKKKTIIAHDIDSCALFFLSRPYLIYHSQGDSVSELISYGNYRYYHIISIWIKQYIAILFCKKITFPTNGAKEVFVGRSLIKNFLINRKSTEPLYGCYIGIDNEYKVLDKENFESLELNILTVSTFIDKKYIESLPGLINSKFSKYNYNWTLVGRGPLKNLIINEIDKYGMGNKTKLITNYISNEELDDYYKKAHVFVMNHKIAICDRAIGQAMYHRLPMVLSRVKSHVEFRENSNLILFWDEFDDFENCYERLLANSIGDQGYEKLWSKGALRMRYKSIFGIE